MAQEDKSRRLTRRADMHLSKSGQIDPSTPDESSQPRRHVSGVSEAGTSREQVQDLGKIVGDTAKGMANPLEWVGASGANGAASGAVKGAAGAATAKEAADATAKVATAKGADLTGKAAKEAVKAKDAATAIQGTTPSAVPPVDGATGPAAGSTHGGTPATTPPSQAPGTAATPRSRADATAPRGPAARPAGPSERPDPTPGAQDSKPTPETGSPAEPGTPAREGGSSKKGDVARGVVDGFLGRSEQGKEAAKERRRQPILNDDRGLLERGSDILQARTGIDSVKTGANVGAVASGGAVPAPLLEGALRLKMQSDRVMVKTAKRAVALFTVVPLLIMFMVPVITATSSGGGDLVSGGEEQSCEIGVIGDVPEVTEVDEEQQGYAATIIDVGRSHDIPEYGWVIAIATAMQESSLRNLDHGDRDSRGLFQQRPSQGWGTIEEITDPVKSTEAFYGVASHTSNRGLVDVDGWEQMTVAVAAQTVQASAYPDAYAKWEGLARSLVKALAGVETVSSGNCGVPTDIPTCDPIPSNIESGLTPDALNAARCAASQFGIDPGRILGKGDRAANPNSDHGSGRAIDIMIPNYRSPEGVAEGDRIAAWFQENAKVFGVTYIIWNAEWWSASNPSRGWTRYSHPSGATDDTNMHLDHVHVSVSGNAGTGFQGGSGTVVGEWAFPAPAGSTVSSKYGRRFHPIQHVWKLHAGTDFRCSIGQPIYAAAGGSVRTQPNWGTAGNAITITHGGGIQTKYFHLNKFRVSSGSTVTAGQLIGECGATGGVTGPHLHFEVHVSGSSTDPEPFLRSKGVL